MNKALAIVMTAAAVLLAGCGGAGGTGGTGSGGDGGAAPAAPPRTSTASADVDWQQINDFYAAEFRLSCTEVGGSAQGKCIATLGKSAHSLLQLARELPDGGAVSVLRENAQTIVDDAVDFEDQSCRSGAGGGCAHIPAEVTASAQAIERTLRNAAG